MSSTYEQQMQHQYHQQQPITQTTRQTVKFLTASTIGTALLILSGLILTGTVIALVIATPIMVLFSPILVPAVITIFLIATGFIFSGGCGVAAVSALTWVYKYTTGENPPGADTLDRARMQIKNAARDVKDRAKDNLQYIQDKAQEGSDVHQRGQ